VSVPTVPAPTTVLALAGTSRVIISIEALVPISIAAAPPSAPVAVPAHIPAIHSRRSTRSPSRSGPEGGDWAHAGPASSAHPAAMISARFIDDAPLGWAHMGFIRSVPTGAPVVKLTSLSRSICAQGNARWVQTFEKLG
jgi:hypothetical protein